MKINIETVVKAPIDKVWSAFNNPEDIKKWNTASDDWHTTECSVDFKEGGRFSSRMEAKDGSFGFDFGGTYNRIIEKNLIEYTLDDGRKVEVHFKQTGIGVKIDETFEAEKQNTLEMQRQGWQSILNNFAKYLLSMD